MDGVGDFTSFLVKLLCGLYSLGWTSEHGRRQVLIVFVLLRLRPHANRASLARFNINRQWEHLQAKYVGTGHADTTKL
jgi:hypothetical protein